MRSRPAIELEPCGPLSRIRIRRCEAIDRKSTRLNSSHRQISYAVFCLKKKKKKKLKKFTKIKKSIKFLINDRYDVLLQLSSKYLHLRSTITDLYSNRHRLKSDIS